MKTDRIFKNNPGLNEYFQTSDGQSFYTADSARMHAKTLSDKKVNHVQKGNEPEAEKPAEKPKKTKAPKQKTAEEIEREKLVLEYKELFGKEPVKNAKNETIQARILEKQEELKAAELEAENAANAKDSEPENSEEELNPNTEETDETED